MPHNGLIQVFENLALIRRLVKEGGSMDVVIVSTPTPIQAEFWQKRLEETRGQVISENAKVIVVWEDWPGGAGNGLGTLYAFAKAREKAWEMYGEDILKGLRDGAAVAIYHTAGKGTRLAPLPGSELNNKPAVKLPGLLKIARQQSFLTILEAVIKQTAIYAPSRKGRVSVFWGDQIFIPSVTPIYSPDHPVDILAQLGKMPTHEEWDRRGMNKYGLIAVDRTGRAGQLEKVDYKTAMNLVESGVVGVEGGIGVSLGSFSMSADFLEALLGEFNRELGQRNIALDTDPHFWMPMTLPRAIYVKTMVRKGMAAGDAEAHFDRMEAFKTRFFNGKHGQPVLGAVNTGREGFWWDFGQLKLYWQNVLKLSRSGDEGRAIRDFFGVETNVHYSAVEKGLEMDENSCLVGCRIKSGKIRNSVLVGVSAEDVEVENCVLIGVTAPSIRGNDGLLYNVAEGSRVNIQPTFARADVFHPNRGQIKLFTQLERDGKNDWLERLPGNTFSYAEIEENNRPVDLENAFKMAQEVHHQVRRMIKV